MIVVSRRVQNGDSIDLVSPTPSSVSTKYDIANSNDGLDLTDALILTFSILIALFLYVIIIAIIFLYLRDRNRRRDYKENFDSKGVQTDLATNFISSRRESLNSQSSSRSAASSTTSSKIRKSSDSTKKHVSIQTTPQASTIIPMPHETQNLVESVTEITKPNSTQKPRRIVPQPAAVIPPPKPYPMNPPPKCPSVLPQECPVIIISPPRNSLQLTDENNQQNEKFADTDIDDQQISKTDIPPSTFASTSTAVAMPSSALIKNTTISSYTGYTGKGKARVF
ncbi:926_t:CDS:1 [Acaulospora colombiana]|uniref:926_t:CDS:1 n=1 Tax=Acaulospora colombiana TaxID=27376 RepID=A0ACA9MQN6_9GLOM|nr:926_t:CDS:1 [Acaulospora colombiana]